MNSDSDDTRNNLQLRIALAIVGVIFLGLIVLVFFTNLQGSDSDDLELICNGDDCTWFPATMVAYLLTALGWDRQLYPVHLTGSVGHLGDDVEVASRLTRISSLVGNYEKMPWSHLVSNSGNALHKALDYSSAAADSE